MRTGADEVGGRAGVGVVVNPHSRRARRRARVTERLARVVGDRGVVACSEGRDELVHIVEDMRRQRVDVIALCGGDGTVGFTLTVLHDVYRAEPLPAIALLRGGTMNTIANSIGTPRRPTEWLLRSLVRRHARGRGHLGSSRRVALAVRGRARDDGVDLGFLFGTGLARGFLEEYYASADQPTHVTAALVLGRLAASSVGGGTLARRVGRRIEIDVTVDGVRWPTASYLGVMAATVSQAGLGFRPFRWTREGLDAFHVVGVHGAIGDVALNLWRTWFARGLGERRARDALVRRATLASRDGAPIPFFLDGDLHDGAATVELSTGPRVRFVW
jgi:hypothetical protein